MFNSFQERWQKVLAVPKTLRYSWWLNVILWLAAAPKPMSEKASRRMLVLLAYLAKKSINNSVSVTETHFDGVRVVIYERKVHADSSPRPGAIWIHGGGLTKGTPELDSKLICEILDHVDMTIVSVDYRLAPEHPYPAAIDDCTTALRWLVGHSKELNVDLNRVVIGGESAGGGLAAALSQRSRDESIVRPVLQILVYPMLDDRTNLKDEHDGRGKLIWTVLHNRHGWESYRGKKCTEPETRPWAVPGRCEDLKDLPPAWVGVGDLDLFYEEDRTYAQRLQAASVPCVFYVTKGGYHAFDSLAPASHEKQQFYKSMITTLVEAVK